MNEYVFGFGTIACAFVMVLICDRLTEDMGKWTARLYRGILMMLYGIMMYCLMGVMNPDTFFQVWEGNITASTWLFAIGWASVATAMFGD